MIGKDNPTGALGANCVHFFQQARLERGAADEFSALFGGNLTIIVRHGKFSNRTTYVVITKADPVVTVVTT